MNLGLVEGPITIDQVNIVVGRMDSGNK